MDNPTKGWRHLATRKPKQGQHCLIRVDQIYEAYYSLDNDDEFKLIDCKDSGLVTCWKPAPKD